MVMEHRWDGGEFFNTSLSPVALTGEVVNDGGRGDGLAGAGRTLDQTERPLQHRLHSINLFCFFYFLKKGGAVQVSCYKDH